MRGKRERERPPNTRAISCYGLHRNQIQLLWIAVFINNLCYFISGMSHNVFSDFQREGADGWWMVKQWEWPQRKWRAPSLHYNSCVSRLSISQVWNNRDAIDVTSARHLKQFEKQQCSLWHKFPDGFVLYQNISLHDLLLKSLKSHWDDLRFSALIEEHLLSFLRQIACQFQLHSDSRLSVTQPAAFLKRFLYSSLSRRCSFQVLQQH